MKNVSVSVLAALLCALLGGCPSSSKKTVGPAKRRDASSAAKVDVKMTGAVQELLTAGRFSEAEARAIDAYRRDPSNLESARTLVRVALAAGGPSWPLAGEALARAPLYPRPEPAVRLLAGIYRLRMEEFADAAAELEPVVRAGRDPLAGLLYGRALAGAGRIEEAQKAYAEGAKRFPSNPHFSYHRGRLLAMSGKEEDAVAVLKGAAVKIPLAHRALAGILIGAGKREEAARHVAAYLESNPPDAAAWRRWLERIGGKR